jgi:hypothetical protein
VAFACAVLACGEAVAQGQQPQREDTAPPPMRYLPEEVRQRLDAEHDLKNRTRLSLELAEERLTRAAEHARAERFEAATGELGVYEAIVEDAFHFLQHSGRVTNKQRDLYKRIEMTLRAHVPRIETIRRALPSDHGVHVKATLDFVRDERDQALNSFYDDTVIPEPQHPKNKVPEGERARGTAPAAPELEKKPDQR